MSGARSQRKGSRAEAEVAKLVRYTFPRAHTCREEQRQGETGADLAGVPFHAQIRRRKLPNIRAALRASVADAIKHGDERPPVAITKADRGDGWLVTMHLDDWLMLLWGRVTRED